MVAVNKVIRVEVEQKAPPPVTETEQKLAKKKKAKVEE